MASSPSHLSPLTLLVFLLTTNAVVTGYELGPPKNTHLHFYFHETFLGPKADTVTVASLHKIDPNSSQTYFGDINVFDVDLREGIDRSSKLIGKAEGMAVHSDLANRQALIPINFVFTAGEYNGSTLTLIGLYKVNAVSDRSIVGGTGRFRMARGYALSKAVNSTATTVTAEFDVYLVHY